MSMHDQALCSVATLPNAAIRSLLVQPSSWKRQGRQQQQEKHGIQALASSIAGFAPTGAAAVGASTSAQQQQQQLKCVSLAGLPQLMEVQAVPEGLRQALVDAYNTSQSSAIAAAVDMKSPVTLVQVSPAYTI
jgi:hypothetical protein